MWIGWQWPLLRASQFMDVAPAGWIPNVGVSSLRLKPDTSDDEIWFGDLGYAREAQASYPVFVAARDRGTLAPGTRLQVCLPTPMAVIGSFVIAQDVPKILPAYERAMLREVSAICAAIPHNELAIQWDVCVEMIQWDGRFPPMPAIPEMEAVFTGAFSRLAAAIPADVEFGIHLCYGDHDNKHFIQPVDLGKAAELANLIVRAAGRPLNWIHMPVPVDRDDSEYFAPLRKLEHGVSTELYLGLVHRQDGVPGSLRRARAAMSHVQHFGIATECGLGRARTPDRAREILQVQADSAAAIGLAV
jgi:methionine synthase II (cobalamin-independent)